MVTIRTYYWAACMCSRERQSEYARFAPTSLASQWADQCAQPERQFEYARFAPNSAASHLAHGVNLSVVVPRQNDSYFLAHRVGIAKFVASGIRCRSNTNLLGVPVMSKRAVPTQMFALRSKHLLPYNSASQRTRIKPRAAERERYAMTWKSPR